LISPGERGDALRSVGVLTGAAGTADRHRM